MGCSSFAQVAPITFIGRLVAVCIGILGILIFAIPAGVIGARFRKAIDDDKRSRELNEVRTRMTKSFRRVANRSLRTYLDSLPDKGGEKYKKLNFVPLHRSVSRMQVRQGLDLKDITAVCSKFPEFRLKDLASASPDEDQASDRFVVEHFPLNRSYGYCINRGSNVTIFSTSSFAEIGAGWFAYYLAKLCGFNYMSKDIEVDPDEADSFFNISKAPLCDKKTKEQWLQMDKKEYDKKVGTSTQFNVLTNYDDAIDILSKKEKARSDFFKDLSTLLKEGSWFIEFNAIDAIKENPFDVVLSDQTRDGKMSSVYDVETYQSLYEVLASCLEKELEVKTALRPARYPLLKNNIAFYVHENLKIECNGFALRVSSKLINLDARNLVAAFLMAQVLSEKLDNNRGIQDEGIKDFSETGFGYQISEAQ